MLRFFVAYRSRCRDTSDKKHRRSYLFGGEKYIFRFTRLHSIFFDGKYVKESQQMLYFSRDKSFNTVKNHLGAFFAVVECKESLGAVVKEEFCFHVCALF